MKIKVSKDHTESGHSGKPKCENRCPGKVHIINMAIKRPNMIKMVHTIMLHVILKYILTVWWRVSWRKRLSKIRLHISSILSSSQVALLPKTNQMNAKIKLRDSQTLHAVAIVFECIYYPKIRLFYLIYSLVIFIRGSSLKIKPN